MGDFKTIQDYESYINTLPLHELKGIAQDIDKDKYPDRYQLLCKIIQEQDNNFQIYEPKDSPKHAGIQRNRGNNLGNQSGRDQSKTGRW
jgi:pSer/pThr/pTyr-binding forkhead associated (FHA) protein